MEISGVTGPNEKAVELTAARFPAPKKTADGESQQIKKADSDSGKETVQRKAAPRPITPVVTRSGTRMHIDEESKRIIAQILDGNNQVIKQIPPEELLKLAARMKDLQEQIFNERV